jgi:hypothetical protein
LQTGIHVRTLTQTAVARAGACSADILDESELGFSIGQAAASRQGDRPMTAYRLRRLTLSCFLLVGVSLLAGCVAAMLADPAER